MERRHEHAHAETRAPRASSGRKERRTQGLPPRNLGLAEVSPQSHPKYLRPAPTGRGQAGPQNQRSPRPGPAPAPAGCPRLPGARAAPPGLGSRRAAGLSSRPRCAARPVRHVLRTRPGSRSGRGSRRGGNPPLRPAPRGRKDVDGGQAEAGAAAGASQGPESGYRVEVEHCCHQRQQEGDGEDREVQHGLPAGATSRLPARRRRLSLAGPEARACALGSRGPGERMGPGGVAKARSRNPGRGWGGRDFRTRPRPRDGVPEGSGARASERRGSSRPSAPTGASSSRLTMKPLGRRGCLPGCRGTYWKNMFLLCFY